ncbi:MAG: FtsX-like permease family protein, partial [Bryobacteraceae bacterium]
HSGGRGAKRLRHVLVVAELAVALVLLIGAGLLARSFMTLSNTELGFSPGRLLTLQVNLVGSRYAKPESQKRFFAEVLERLDQLPMLRQAAASTDIPLSGEGPYSGVGVAFQVAGRVPVPVSQQPRAGVTMVSRDFFRTLGIPVREGRTFDSQDTSQRVDNIVVNEAFVRKIFPGESPLGKGIVFGQNESSRWTIVGVVGSIRGSHLGADPAPLVYRCICQSSGPFLSRMGFLIRTADDPRQATRAIEAQIYAADRNQPVFDVKTMEERLAASLAPQGFYLLLIGIFALIAVALAAIGVYGVMSYLVALRTREIGIRVAMGARLGHVLRLVLGESLALMLMAVVVGLGCAWGLTRYLESMLYGVTALDKWTFAMMPAVLGIIALTASLVPAIHALQVDPTTALREE